MKPTLALIFTLLTLARTPAFGRALEERLGVGMGLHDLGQSPVLSLRYVPVNHWAVGFQMGFDTGASGYTILGARLNRHLDLQEHLNAYLGINGFFLARRSAGVTTQGYELDAVIGFEAFPPGLADLGFAFESGIAYRSLGGTSLKTLGSGFLMASVHYYF